MLRFPNLLIPPLLLGAVGMSGYWYARSYAPIVPVPLVGFPESIKVEFTKWENWAQEFSVHSWIAHPSSAEQVLELANWARRHAFRLRPSGYRHSFSPITVQNSDETERIVIVDTTKYLTQMKVNKEDSSFWAEPGVKLETALKVIEEHDLSLAAFPAIGEISLGGAVSAGAHGKGFPSVKEKGHSYGSLANLIVSFTAIVYDSQVDAYVLKDFHRSNPEASAFLISLGKSFLTNITLRAGPLLRVHSKLYRVKPETFFAESETTEESYMDYWNKGIELIQAIYFPFLNNTVVVYGTRVSPAKPSDAVEVKTPYNYGDFLTGDSFNIWGTIGNVLLFAKPDIAKLTTGSWSIITSSKNIQPTLHKVYSFFIERVRDYEVKWGLSNIFLEVRVITLDDPNDVGIPGAQSPGLGAGSVIEGRPDLNVTLSVEIAGLTSKDVEAFRSLMMEFEGFLWGNVNTEGAVVRVEWAKGWGITPAGPSTNEALMLNLMRSGRYSKWRESVAILHSYDPWGVFSSPLIDTILYSQI